MQLVDAGDGERPGLGALTDRIAPGRVIGLPAGEISSLAYDSRLVVRGALFFAVPGEHVDGHDFAADATARGARAVVVERELHGLEATQLIVHDTRVALADAADLWFGEPSRQLDVFGVTGTNGKTTTSFLLTDLLDAAGRHPGLIGTVATRIGDETRPNLTRTTTPEALELQAMLAEMVDAGNQSAVIETSSHALAQGRVRNCRYQLGVVTNLTHEHLEFHGSFEAYRAAKARLVEEAPTAVLNADDPSFGYFAARAGGRVMSYAVRRSADVSAHDVELRVDGARFNVTGPDRWGGPISLPLPGEFNVENALAALAAANALGIEFEVARGALANAKAVPGRMQRIDQGQPFSVLVDYAHTPDSLEKVLRILRPLTAGQLIAVFGSAGERDVLKRPAMGRLAAELADAVVITDEDPRLEDPDEVNQQIADGARAAGARDGERLWVINDRRAAIRYAFEMARAGDTLLLAGKGHEHSIFIGSEATWWDEAEVARQELREAGYGAEPA
jgi:UDP-N-acetylmuramoyl-L-alanyl-D-glutamate--2,6-diaminopimelate ligase